MLETNNITILEIVGLVSIIQITIFLVWIAIADGIKKSRLCTLKYLSVINEKLDTIMDQTQQLKDLLVKIDTDLTEIGVNIEEIETDITDVSNDQDTLLEKIRELEGQENPDLTEILAQATAISDKLNNTKILVSDAKTGLSNLDTKVPE